MNAIYWTLRICCVIAYRIVGGLKIYGRENLIEEGPAIYAANHASYLDPPLVGVTARKAIYYLARKSLFEEKPICYVLPFLNLVPVDTTGKDMSAVKKVIQLLQKRRRVLLFPEGTRTRDGNLQRAQPGLGLVVAKTFAPVVPIRIFGTFEMFPRGAKQFRRAPLSVVVGTPLRFSKEDVGNGGREDYQRISDRVMAAIAALERPCKP